MDLATLLLPCSSVFRTLYLSGASQIKTGFFPVTGISTGCHRHSGSASRHFRLPENNQTPVTVASINSLTLISSHWKPQTIANTSNSQPEQQRGTLTPLSNNGWAQFSTLFCFKGPHFSQVDDIFTVATTSCKNSKLFSWIKLPFFEGMSPSSYHGEANLFWDNRTYHPAGIHLIPDICGQELLTVNRSPTLQPPFGPQLLCPP